MSDKRIIIGQSEFGFADEQQDSIIGQIKQAVADGASVVLGLLNPDGKPVEVILSGRSVEIVVIDLNSGPRPSEIS